MTLEEFLTEAEIKRQFKEVSRFKVGELTYIVKMGKASLELELTDGTKKQIEAVSPDVAISIFSSMKREVPKREADPNVNFARRKVRETFNNLYDKSYRQLSDKEVAKFNTKNAIPQILDTIKSYLDKYKTEYILVSPYKDNEEKRARAYGIMLKRMGYTEIYNNDKIILYSNKKEKVQSTSVPEMTTYRWKNAPPVIKNIRFLMSNI